MREWNCLKVSLEERVSSKTGLWVLWEKCIKSRKNLWFNCAFLLAFAVCLVYNENLNLSEAGKKLSFEKIVKEW
ncbi:MAG: hypothetical protein IJ733_05240 [Lachnospiraceae bacterium]|nr:hypothetical protein [Lachnospiraceae bacterium]